MAIATDPSAAAMQQIVTRINTGSGGDYTLPAAATLSFERIEDLKDTATATLSVTVVEEGQNKFNELLDYNNISEHHLRVWFRKKVASKAAATISPLNLIVAQVADFLDSPSTDSSTVKLWEIDEDEDRQPDRELLRLDSVYAASLALLVRVES